MNTKSIRFLVVILLILIMYPTYAQELNGLIDAEVRRLDINKKGMLALTSWAGVNIVTGTIGMFTAKGEAKYFHQMNALWNVVNLGLGISGYIGAVKADPQGLSESEIVKNFQSTQNIFILNAGLDAAYIMTGVFLIERARHSEKHQNQLKGYGKSIILQGAFLLTFDAIMFAIQQRSANLNLYPLLGQDVVGLGMTFRF